MTVVGFPTDLQVEEFRGQFVTIYRDAFSAPPYCKGEAEVVGFARSFSQHVGREGFRMVTASDGEAGPIVGFAYGYANTPDQLWHEVVAKAVQPPVVAEWLMDSFRLVEMAVVPRAQGQGIGGLLHDRLLSGLLCRKAVLSTLAAETNAYGMYRKRGWVVLLEEIWFPGVARPYQIMGLELGGKGKQKE